MKRIIVFFMICMTSVLSGKERTSQNVPIAYYINEAGVMVGDFYYNTNFLKEESKFTSVLLYSPSTEIFTVMGTLKDYRLNDKLYLGSKVRYIKFNDVHNGWPGNDSSDEEQKISYIEEYGYVPVTKGYDNYKGNTQLYDLHMSYELSRKDSLISSYIYESLKSQRREYKSDSISLTWDRNDTDSKNNPRNGYRMLAGVKKSLNMLGHDSENDWDYYKLSFDFRKYFPLLKKSALALRFYTEATGGKEVVDKDRTNVLKIMGEDGEVSYYAPFFDNALLGNLQNFKGYYFYRFYDKHMALLQAEFRFPMDKVLDGLQGNLFGEFGRVGSEYDVDLFTKDLKLCFGLGFRYFFNDDIVIRADGGASNEGVQMRINEGQVF